MSDVPAPRRRRIIALLETRDDWVRVPGARPLGGEGEQTMADPDRAESELERQERKARERRYRDRVEAEMDQAAGVERSGPTRNEAARKAHYASGDYQVLDQALAELKRKQPYSYWILDRLYVQGLPLRVQDYRLDAAIRALSDRLPFALRVPVHELDEPETREERDRRIAAWSAAGKSTRWIAARVDLTHPRIVQILARQRAADPKAA